MVLYSLLVPTFRAPDEYMHVDLVRMVANGEGYPEYDGRELSRAVLDARDTSSAYTSFTDAVGADGA